MNIIKEFTGLDTAGRSRLYALCKCVVCNLEYTKQKRQLNDYGTCSLQCTSVAKGNSILTNCAHCNKQIFKKKSDVEISKSGKFFCSRDCKDTAQSYMKEIQPAHYGSGTSSYRERAFRHYKNVCNNCGYSNKDALEVHHKDKNRDNNSIENLEILCANCHTLIHKGLRTRVQD